MPSVLQTETIPNRASYATLRYEGVPPARAKLVLGLGETTAAQLERLFQVCPGGGDDPMRPRFARHTAHIKAVRALGGYPALPERRR
jgi:hypothetical protein